MRPILIVLTCLVASLVLGQTTPKMGSPERKALMDAIRGPVQKDIGQKVQFKVDWLKVQGNWAFLKGKPVQANGKDIDYHGTKYEEAVKAGAFGYGIDCLYRRTGGAWKVVKYVLGASDVPYTMWWKEFGAPKKIFDLTEGGG
jgi:hypothetical protein